MERIEEALFKGMTVAGWSSSEIKIVLEEIARQGHNISGGSVDKYEVSFRINGKRTEMKRGA